MLRRLYRIFAIGVGLCAALGAVRLIAPAIGGPVDEPPGVSRQLTFLRSALDGGAAEEMQRLFPEGYFFSHVLYGLSWVEFGMRAPAGERSTALREARWAVAKLASVVGRAPFDPRLSPPYGVFYRGWSTWLRGGVLSLQPSETRDPAEVRTFAEEAGSLAAAFDTSASPYLQAYPSQAWPVDSVVAIASLRLHDTLLPGRYSSTVDRWLRAVRMRLDPRTGLVPHRVTPDTGEPISVARGSSQSIIQRFLPEIDPGFAAEQYLRFRDRFVVSPLGLGPAVREYPSGTDGPADVDSGPLLLGVSASASAVAIGAAQVHGDFALADALAGYAELLAVPVDTPWTKRYLFGLLPVADAFLAWSKTARTWIRPGSPAAPAQTSPWWKVPLLTSLVVLGIAPWLPMVVRRRRRSEPSPSAHTATRQVGSPAADHRRGGRPESGHTPLPFGH